MRILRERIASRFSTTTAPHFPMPTASHAATTLVQFILEESVKQEPVIPTPTKDRNRRVRLLDGAGCFASEIDREVSWQSTLVKPSNISMTT